MHSNPLISALEQIGRDDSMLREQAAKLYQTTESLAEANSQRQQIETELVDAKNSLATELAAMTRLHEFCTRLLPRMELRPLLEEILGASMELQNADFGMVQLYDRQRRTLELVSQRGFSGEFLDRFKSARNNTTVCGRALS